mmetsp:Transcript_7638/g.14886  ORF Transcript_7638/g.14886 Transcript_7638/m.14886 type:complete len:241 (-) Transcript_7638:1141-1863(-)
MSVHIVIPVGQLPLQHQICNVLRQDHVLRPSKDSALPSDDELCQLSARESLCALCDAIEIGLVDGGVDEDFLSGLEGLVEILLHEHRDHSRALLQTWKGKLERVVDSIQNRPVQDVPNVCGHHDAELVTLSARVGKERREHVPHVLRHSPLGPPPSTKERIGLINEQNQTPPAAVGPLEQLIHFIHRVLPERSYVASAHDRVVKTRLSCQCPCKEGLACARSSVEHQVPEGSAILLRVDE